MAKTSSLDRQAHPFKITKWHTVFTRKSAAAAYYIVRLFDAPL